MTDEQIAKFFIYTNDGIGIRLILDGNINKMKDELENMYYAFYAQIKS